MSTPFSLPRSLTVLVAVVACAVVLPAVAAAGSPEPAPTTSPTPTVATAPVFPVFPFLDAVRPPLAQPRVYDVSFPQCGRTLPGAVSSGIVGVDGGRVRRANPCLGALLTWAAGASTLGPSYYVNTANPGPLVSDFWPSGAQAPKPCAADYPASDSPECAYDYGWNNAADSWARAAAAAAQAGARDPVTSTWWLDVETGNSWESLQWGGSPTTYANDTAALQGTVDYLRAQGVADVGVYSTGRAWVEITGGATLGRLPVWYAGTGSLEAAITHCGVDWSFTGGPVRLAQYAAGEFDASQGC